MKALLYKLFIATAQITIGIIMLTGIAMIGLNLYIYS